MSESPLTRQGLPPVLADLVRFYCNSKTIEGIRLLFSELIEVHKVYLQCKAWLSSYCSFCVILNSTKVRHFHPGRRYRRFNAIVSQLRFWPFWVLFLKLWLKFIHIDQRQNMNWLLAANFEATNVTFLPKKLASNVQFSCIDKLKWPKSELWHYCIKATIYIYLYIYLLQFWFQGTKNWY